MKKDEVICIEDVLNNKTRDIVEIRVHFYTNVSLSTEKV